MQVKENAFQALNSIDVSQAQDSATHTIYKWIDSNGVLQYTNIPPPGINTEIVQVDPDSNLIPAVDASQVATPLAGVPANAEKSPAAPDEPFPYKPEQIKKAMDAARNTQQMMDERLEKQQQIFDKL